MMNFRQSWLCLLLAIGLVVFSSGPVRAEASEFDSVQQMIEHFNDFTIEQGTLEWIDKESNEFRVSEMVVKNDFPDVIDELNKQALITGVYRSFIHTPVDSVHVHAIPLQIDPKSDESQLQQGRAIELEVTRQQATAALRAVLGTVDLEKLVHTEKIGDYEIDDMWSDRFVSVFYRSHKPGLDRFYSELVRQTQSD